MVKIGGARLEDVSPFFHLPIEEAARELGVCSSALKRRCRRLGIKRWPFRKVRAIPAAQEKGGCLLHIGDYCTSGVRSMSNSLSRTMEGMCNVGAGGIVPPEYLQPDAATRLAAQVAAANLINLDQTRRPLLPSMNRPLMGARGAAGAAAAAAGGDAGAGVGEMVAQMGGSGGGDGVNGEGDENQEAGAIVLHMGDSPVLAWESPDKRDEQNPWEGGEGGMESGFRGAELTIREGAMGEGGPSLMLYHHPRQSCSCFPSSLPRSLFSRSSLPPTASLLSPPSPLFLLLLGTTESTSPHRPLAIGAAAALC
ncbi:unnamed protein product [Closterium sp. Yama58-4]|nr:unnamed protein product [Closterium sp. Yama58-4]